MSKIEIKRIDQNEANLVVGLFNQYRIFYGKFSDLGMAKDFIDARLENNESVIFVALDENNPVGFTQLYPKYSSVRLVKNWILNDLFVNPEYRKQGIGEALIKTVMDFAKGQGAVYVQLETAVDNFTAQSLYEQIGFVKQGPDEEFLLYKIEL
ncbi:GNAT family N-acetyltransferase [Pedobacter chitinilyticus]|uniref:GNAT family N-acetyltransferase n=1 Tax=Pedobacter chitinilyticus TaxID=2233776 RepID=A0A3S3QFV5_9SPHI|nr:GNAT family N-acetyltransferase [Pedobacter chitinilyticus]RWU07764.1 GNAT family N-acetyltransferase [Pedobacter chitinilyticus]